MAYLVAYGSERVKYEKNNALRILVEKNQTYSSLFAFINKISMNILWKLVASFKFKEEPHTYFKTLYKAQNKERISVSKMPIS